MNRQRVTLQHGSLAYALLHAAQCVAAVIGDEGENLTAGFERMLHDHPEWTDAIRGAVRDLTWTTLREYGRGDVVLRHFVQKPLPTAIHALLLVALCRFEQRPQDAHTVVDQAVDAAGQLAPGLKGVVNGVLRNVLRQHSELPRWREQDMAARHAHPAWWIRRVRAQHPRHWKAILAAGNLHPPMSLRVNRRRATVEACLEQLAAAAIAARRLDNDALLLERALPISRLPGFADGWVSVQDAGAQWAARWLDARDGERVLDACAAPGGKAAHLLECADIDLTALELDPLRAERIWDNLNRLGLSATVKASDCCALEDWWDGKPFDRILADVPCSASGVVRRHPDIKWLRRESDIARFAARQAEIIDALWRVLTPNGIMLYVSCSVFDEENRLQIESFLARHPDAESSPFPSQADKPSYLLPTTEHDGFYFARIHKR
ncbi:MAG: 16S rRNA (cytosine(967)-C(5))-methyltransferase RsmB [Azoarcus sp.]|jgi:16S rRNA (cytosine967-C5)-methyltransferase|nr:16S rRNA (cytosine(967)-C(5))-methyltransferase RsmB [Azoarcus sp.]